MRSMVCSANGGRPRLPSGANGAINHQRIPRHDAVHLVEELALARALGSLGSGPSQSAS